LGHFAITLNSKLDYQGPFLALLIQRAALQRGVERTSTHVVD
jgi:hypothetical protein